MRGAPGRGRIAVRGRKFPLRATKTTEYFLAKIDIYPPPGVIQTNKEDKYVARERVKVFHMRWFYRIDFLWRDGSTKERDPLRA